MASLQSALGNVEARRRLATPPLQTKLRVSEPGDAHEHEADRVADAVMRAANPPTAGPDQDEEQPLVQAKLDQDQEEESLVHTKLEAARQEDEEEEALVQTKADGAGAMSPDVEAGIGASRGGGHPLDSGTRSFYEPRFGRDLSGVKIHNDAHAAALASDLNAQAFTVGRDVYFAGGRYQPGTESGRWLLAHELTHTVQQRPGAKLEPAGSGGVMSRVTRADRQVQRNGGGGGGGAAAGAIPAEAGVVDEATAEIRYPVLELPGFKASGHRGATYAAHDIKRSRNYARGNPDQTSVWDRSVTDLTLEDKLKARLASTYDGASPQKVYILRHPNTGFRLIGTLAQMVDAAKRPIWSPAGRPRPKDVDHIVELQISGWPEAGWANVAGVGGNMELLDSEANQDSGRRIMGEVGRLVKLTRDYYWKTPSDGAGAVPGSDASFWVKSRKPSLRSIKQRYDLVFASTRRGLGQAGIPANHWKWVEIARDTAHLDPFVPDTDGFDSGRWTVFPSSSGGVPARISHTDGAPRPPRPREVRGWFDPFRVRSVSLADPGTLAADAATDPGSITLGMPEEAQGRRTPYHFNLNQALPLRRFPGIPNAVYLDADGIDAVWRALSIRYMSPIAIQSWSVVPGRGLQARGRLLPSVPIISTLGIDFVIDGDDLRLSKRFDVGEFDLPGPIEVTDSSIEVFAGRRGFGASGEMGLAIPDVGEGRLRARVDRGGFALSGSFDFDPELFDPPSRITMGYTGGVDGAGGSFSGSGTLTIGPERVRGIRSATVNVAYEQGTLSASGEAELDVPGLEQGSMSLTYSEEEGLAIEGAFVLSSDIPGIRSGSVSAGVRRRAEGEGYEVSASGTAVPDIPGFDASVAVSYQDGIFTAEGTAQYSRGMLEGSLQVGATNRSIDDEGNPGEEATDELRAFGGGSLTLALAPWLEATAGVRVTPEAEIEVTGRIGLPSSLELFPARRYDKNLLTIDLPRIPIVGVSVAGQSIGIFATIGGGLDLTAGFGPGELQDLHLAVTYNPDHEEDTLVEGGAQFVVPADAGLRLFVRGSLGVGIPVVSASAGLEIGGQLGIEGAVRAGVQVSWTPTRGLDLLAQAEIFAEPVFRFDIKGFVEVEADLWVTTIELYSKEWELGAFEYGSGLRLGATFPIHYQEGQPFDLSLDDIEFDIPDIDPMALISGLVDQIT